MFIKNNNKITTIGMFVAVVIFLLVLIAPSVLAIGYGLDTTATGGYGDGATKVDNIPATIGKVVGAALAFVGVVFLILMIYGGFLWMLARGNETEVTKAKDTIIAAIIGLIIVLSAYAITSYIGTALQQ